MLHVMLYADCMISIHAPTRGATVNRQHCHKMVLNFNPRSHKGSDVILLSIFSLFALFQSTLPQGERPMERKQSAYRGYFNPRSHKGSDNNWRWRAKPCTYFNPRSHKGSDCEHDNKQMIEQISIHAPTRGATVTLSARASRSLISIHAPTRGATVY